jgi:hypothetical protein
MTQYSKDKKINTYKGIHMQIKRYARFILEGLPDEAYKHRMTDKELMDLRDASIQLLLKMGELNSARNIFGDNDRDYNLRNFNNNKKGE